MKFTTMRCPQVVLLISINLTCTSRGCTATRRKHAPRGRCQSTPLVSCSRGSSQRPRKWLLPRLQTTCDSKGIRCIVHNLVSLVSVQRLMLEPVVLKDLIVRKVESALHVLEAPVGSVMTGPVSATRFATYEMCHERPSVIVCTTINTATATRAQFHQFLEALHKHDPVTMQAVGMLQKHLRSPSLLVGR